MTRKTLAVIPARAGSKRIPDKNARRIDGATLVEHAAKAAIDADVTRVVVSTDARRLARLLPVVMRPAELAGPRADIKDAVRHALVSVEASEGRRFNEVITLQPTLPVRPRGLIPAMLREKRRARARSALTVVRTVPWVWRIEGEAAANEWHPDPYPRSQDCRHAYAQEINSVTIADRDVVLAGFRWDLPLLLCFLPPWAAVDIDSQEDLDEARRIWPLVKDRCVTDIETRLVTRIDQLAPKLSEAHTSGLAA